MWCQSKFFYDNRIELKYQLFELTLSLEPTIFGNVRFNEYASPERGRTTLSRFHKRLDKKLFGKDFHRVSPIKRTRFIACPETVDGELHYHLAIRPPHNKTERLLEVIETTWKQICKPGDSMFYEANDLESIRKSSYYCVKESFIERNFENFVISDEFLPRTITR